MNNQEINTPLNPDQALEELEKEGVEKYLSEIAHIFSGTDYKKNPVGDTVPIYGTGGLMGYTSIPLYNGPAVLSGRKGSINNPMYIEGAFWNVDTIFCIKTNEGVDTKWLYYNFLNTDLSTLNEATGVPSVNSKALYKLKFKWFDFPQQQKIAKILSTADAVIEKTQAAIDKYKAIKQGLLHDLFTRGVVPETVKVQNEKGEEEEKTVWKLRPTYQDAPHLYRESKLGMVPREWEVERLKVYCDRISVGIATSSSDYFVEQGVLFLRNQNIKENRVDLSDTIYISQEFADANSSKYLKKGDVITVRTGYPGISAVVEPELENSQTFTTLITTPNSKMLDSYFLAYFLNSDYGRVQVLNLQGGGAQQNLNSGALETMQILKPELSEQKEIVKKLKSIEKNIQTEQAYLQKLHQLKAGLMGDLLSGRVRVK